MTTGRINQVARPRHNSDQTHNHRPSDGRGKTKVARRNRHNEQHEQGADGTEAHSRGGHICNSFTGLASPPSRNKNAARQFSKQRVKESHFLRSTHRALEQGTKNTHEASAKTNTADEGIPDAGNFRTSSKIIRGASHMRGPL